MLIPTTEFQIDDTVYWFDKNGNRLAGIGAVTELSTTVPGRIKVNVLSGKKEHKRWVHASYLHKAETIDSE